MQFAKANHNCLQNSQHIVGKAWIVWFLHSRMHVNWNSTVWTYIYIYIFICIYIYIYIYIHITTILCMKKRTWTSQKMKDLIITMFAYVAWSRFAWRRRALKELSLKKALAHALQYTPQENRRVKNTVGLATSPSCASVTCADALLSWRSNFS